MKSIDILGILVRNGDRLGINYEKGMKTNESVFKGNFSLKIVYIFTK